MVRRIVEATLRFPVVVLGLILALVALGVPQVHDMAVDELPDYAPVSVEVQTESLGLSAVEVEQLITAPMEQLLLNGVPWLDDITSRSIPGLSSIAMVFEPGTDPLEARQVVQERLSQGRDLPKVAKAPVMLQPTSSASRVMMVRLDSTDLSPIEQSVLARWTVKPALMGVPGVANVAIWGEREQQMQVQVDPKRLADRGVAINQVVKTTANALWVSPLSFVRASTPGTGGFIDTPNQRLGVHHVLPINKPEELGTVSLEGDDGKPVLGRSGRPVPLGDVVDVVEDHQPLIGDAVAGESQGLMLVIEKFPEANTLAVTENVEEALDALRPGLDGLTINTDVFRPATYLEKVLGTFSWLLAFCLLLVALALALVHGWRLALVGLVTVPLSFLAATLVLQWRGEGFNQMLLAGLTVAAAAVIDDAVVTFDHIQRRLREEGGWRRQVNVVVDAVSDVCRPLTVATLVMVAAALPVIYVGHQSGLAGSFLRSTVLSYVLALVVSLVVSLVMAPLLAALLLRGRASMRGDSPLGRRMGSAYASALARTAARPTVLVAGFLVVALTGLAATPLLTTDMRPGLKAPTLVVEWNATPGTSRTEMARITDRVADELRQVPGIREVGAHIGRAVTSDQVRNVDSGELWATIREGADYQETVGAAESVVTGYPGISAEVLTYGDERLRARGVGIPEAKEVVARVYGQEADVIAEKADELRAAMSELDGVTGAVVEQIPQEAQLQVEVDLAVAQRFGLTPGEIRRTAATLVAGIEVGSLFEQQKVFQVIVVGVPSLRHDLSVVENLLIAAPDGRTVRLGDVANVTLVAEPTSIAHSSVSRYVDVVAQVDGRSVRDVAGDVERAVAAVDFPLDYHGEVVGDHEAASAERVRLGAFAVAGLVLILLLMQAQLGSWRLAVLAYLGLPIALSGAILVVVLTGSTLRMGALFGLVLLTGMYSRNVLGLFATYSRLVRGTGRRPQLADVLAGSKERFLPTAATTAAVAAMMTPLVVLGDRPGLEILGPMAAAILGGLVTITFLSLFLLPVAYLRFAPSEDIDPPTEPGTPTGRPEAARLSEVV
jgi:Cu/Ag efflux pump CusA